MVYRHIYPLIGFDTGTQSRLAGCISRMTVDMDVDADSDVAEDAAEDWAPSSQPPCGTTVMSPPPFVTLMNWVRTSGMTRTLAMILLVSDGFRTDLIITRPLHPRLRLRLMGLCQSLLQHGHLMTKMQGHPGCLTLRTFPPAPPWIITNSPRDFTQDPILPKCHGDSHIAIIFYPLNSRPTQRT